MDYEFYANTSMLFVIIAILLAITTLIVFIVQISTNKGKNTVRIMYMCVTLCLFLGSLFSLIPIARDVYTNNFIDLPMIGG